MKWRRLSKRSCCLVIMVILVTVIFVPWQLQHVAWQLIVKTSGEDERVVFNLSDRDVGILTEGIKNTFKIGRNSTNGLTRTFKILSWYNYQNYTLEPRWRSQKTWTVGNCVVTTDRKELIYSHAVVIPMQMYVIYRRFDSLPNTRLTSQWWVMMYDECPASIANNKDWTSGRFKKMFNWTMSYLLDSDIPIPYGWSEKRHTPVEVKQNFASYHRNDTVLVAAAISNCWISKQRLEYVRELKKHVSLDFYGACGDKTCTGELYVTPCAEIEQHKFFLAFENSNCKEYITEKLWLHGYQRNVIPIVMGASKSDYLAVAPPHSFIHVDDFESPKALADYLLTLDKNDTAYNAYFKWKGSYTTHVRQQFLGMRPWKLLCDKLNSVNDMDQKIYDDVRKWFNKDKMCHTPRQT